MNFELHPTLEQDTFKITRLPYSELLLMNNRLFPWLILVPRIDKTVNELHDLSREEQPLLIHEISQISSKLKRFTRADKINIATFGNRVKQLHIHIIARFEDDPAWPNSVFGAGAELYTPHEASTWINHFRQAP